MTIEIQVILTENLKEFRLPFHVVTDWLRYKFVTEIQVILTENLKEFRLPLHVVTDWLS